MAVLGEDALGMKLHTPNGQLTVAQTHYFPFFRFRSDFKTIRKRFALYDERVIARGDVGGGDVFEQIFSVVSDG